MFRYTLPAPILVLFLAFVAPCTRAQTVQPPIAAGTAPAAVAVNPITNKIYVANEQSDSVTVLDGRTRTTTTVAVGSHPEFVAINTATNRIYVNGGDASVTVIDGSTDTVIGTFPVGSTGPMTIDTAANKVFIVRLTTAATDEVTAFDGAANSWHTFSTQSFQPSAIAYNPVTNLLYIAHYGTGDVRVIDAADTGQDDPPTTSVPVWHKPVAIAVNPATNRIYVIGDNTQGPINVIDGTNNTAVFFAPAGHAVGPQAIAVNPATDKVYAGFQGEVIVIDGATNNLTFIPSGDASSSVVALGVNAITNKVYAVNSSGTVTVIDGDTNAASPLAIDAGAVAVGVNPVTNAAYVVGPAITEIDGAAADTIHPVPLTTAITPLAGNASGPNPTFTLTATSGFSPNATPIRGVYVQLDGKDAAWTRASGTGPYTAAFTGLANGAHTLYAFAVDGQEAPSVVTDEQSTPIVGNLTSYTFTVGVATGPTLTAVKSRKDHGSAGTFDIALDTSQPISGAITVEPRVIGAGHTIVFQFDRAISAPGTASATDAGGAPIGTVSASASGSEVTVTIANVPDNRRVTVSLANVDNAGTNASATVGFLMGDVNSSRSVSAADILAIKFRSGSLVDASNFLYDLNLSGGISAADILMAKSAAGTMMN